MSDVLCGKCWLENDDPICTSPDLHIDQEHQERQVTVEDENQLDLFEN